MKMATEKSRPTTMPGFNQALAHSTTTKSWHCCQQGSQRASAAQSLRLTLRGLPIRHCRLRWRRHCPCLVPRQGGLDLLFVLTAHIATKQVNLREGQIVLQSVAEALRTPIAELIGAEIPH